MSKPTSFINPYHFLPLPPKENVSQAEGSQGDTFLPKDAVEKVLKKGEADPSVEHLRHDRYSEQLHSGRILCKLTTLSPCVFGNEHETASGGWSAKVKNYELNGKPAIAATQLRGCIGNLMEAISGSSMRVLEERKLVFKKRNARIKSTVYLYDYFRKAGLKELLPFSAERNTISIVDSILGFIDGEEKDTKQSSGCLTAYASRIQFSAAVNPEANKSWYMKKSNSLEDACTGNWFALKILDSPKPPCPEFYFCDEDRKFIFRNNLNAANDGSQRPRGWKFYLHDPRAIDWDCIEGTPVRCEEGKYTWETNNVIENPIPENDKARRKQKMLVQPIAPGMDFYFHIDFHNLTDVELALLQKAVKPTKEFCHKLGLGKPIGLGSVKIDLVGTFLVNRKNRYSSDINLINNNLSERTVRRYASKDILSQDQIEEFPEIYNREKDAASSHQLPVKLLSELELDEKLQSALNALGDPQMILKLAPIDSNIIVNYPFVVDTEDKLYEWFVNEIVNSTNPLGLTNQPEALPCKR